MLEGLIREIIHELLELSVTPHVRELRAKTVTYGRVIGQWAMHPPTEPQREAMFECVTELQEKVRLAKLEPGNTARPARDRMSSPRLSSPPASEPLDEHTWEELMADGTGVRRRTTQTSIPPVRVTQPPSSSSSLSPRTAPTVPPMSRTRGAMPEVDASSPVNPGLRTRRTRG